MTAVILTFLMLLTPSKHDTETQAERFERMLVIATAIDIAASEAVCENQPQGCQRTWRSTKLKLIATLLAQGEAESRFGQRTHSGDCMPGYCDQRPDGSFAARGPWNVHRGSTPKTSDLWLAASGDGLTETTNAARLAVYYFSVLRCGGNDEQMFQAQDGHGCRSGERGKNRAAWLRQLSAMDRGVRLAWAD